MSSQRASLGLPPFGRTMKILTATLVGAWVVMVLLFYQQPTTIQSVYSFLTLNPSLVLEGYVFQIFSYMFLHELNSPVQLLFVLLGIYFFHGPLEQRWGSNKTLQFAFAAGIGGGVMAVLFHLVSLLIKGSALSVTLGASGVAFGMLAAFCLLQPTAQILLFFVIPIRALYLLPLSLGIDFLMWLAPSGDTFFPAHLGGAVTAWLWLNGWLKPTEWGERIRELRYRRRMAEDRKRGGNVRRGPWLN